MSQILNPYLSFRGQARDAMNFYAEALGGSVEFHTFGDMGMTGDGAAMIMHARLDTPTGLTLMGADTPPDRPMTVGDNITVSISGTDDAALRGYWDRLSAGATVGMPLEKQMWGDVFGYLVDQFGVGWLVNISSDEG